MLEQSRSEVPETYFAPAGRDLPEEFARKRSLVQHSQLLAAALDSLPSMVMVLNLRRQIVAANKAMLRVLEKSEADLCEKRPGEVIGCQRAAEGPEGCGTSRHCATCGAVRSILECQTQRCQVVRECRILTAGLDETRAIDLRVSATPIEVEGEAFIVVAVEDISQSKRKAVLERVFFHDVLNTAGCIAGYAAYLGQRRDAVAEVSNLLAQLSDQLVEEIQAQRDLVLAESGDLELQTDMIVSRKILDDLRAQYLRSPVAVGRQIVLEDVWTGVLWTDRRLLLRILGNMLKNALEATPPGGTVALRCADRGPTAQFAVHNPGVMPEEVRLQMFQRSFSTKGQPGRGIGTYSMKLLGERYLGGQVDFTSQEPEGTTFTLRLPKTR